MEKSKLEKEGIEYEKRNGVNHGKENKNEGEGKGEGKAEPKGEE